MKYIIKETADLTFADMCLKEAGFDFKKKGRPAEPFAGISYEEEYAIRNKVFREFCGKYHSINPENIVKAPVFRGYRNTSKRKAVASGRTIRLLPDSDDDSGVSVLEPSIHSEIFDALEKLISELPSKISHSIHFCILRGIEECAMIFNLDYVDGKTVRIMTKTAETLREKFPGMSSAFLFHDPSRSRYYLDMSASGDYSQMKRLFGPRMLQLKASGVIFHYHPLSFSQVNIPVAELLSSSIAEYFSGVDGRLVDLYCGFGFFTCGVGRKFKSITAIDSAKESVSAAMENAAHVKGFPRAEFLIKRIDAKVIASALPDKTRSECIILDPPRKGCLPGVIQECAERRSEKVVHIFCGADEIFRETGIWERSGYRVKKIVPFDMFPGTASIETAVYLEPK